MKKLTMLAKLTFLTVGFMILAGMVPVSGQKPPKSPGCKTTVSCSGYIWCSCGDADCSSCAIPSGGGGCGHCSN
jgi:hypothetical protein